MVAENFNVIKDSSALCGWKLESISSPNIEMEMPENVYNAFEGKFIKAEELLPRIKTVRVAIAGCTNSFRSVNEIAFERNSVIQTFTLKSGINEVDDMIDFCIDVPDADAINGAAAKEYEKFHIIKMDRDVAGKDTSIHAYVQTPKDGRLRCQFPKDVRVAAKRNNIKYWVDNYRIDAGSNGGKFVRIVGAPKELM